MDEGDSSEDVTLKINSRLFTLCCVYSSSLKMSNVDEFAWSLILGGSPQSRLQRERKIRRRMSTSSTKSEIRHFHIAVVHPVKAKKCTNKRAARAKKVVAYCFHGVFVTVTVVVAKSPC